MRKISPMPKLAARRRVPPPAPRACAAPTESHARIVDVYPIECDHIYVNRVISHEVIVSEYIILQTLHRRFRSGTPFVGLILKTCPRQKRSLTPSARNSAHMNLMLGDVQFCRVETSVALWQTRTACTHSRRQSACASWLCTR